jgi:hypothetical protein
MTNDNYTEDMGDIMSCARERRMAMQILQAWDDGGLPDDFYEDGVKFAFNRNSGNVFLVNGDYQVAMMNGDRLESFYTSPYEGREGFFSDLLEEYPDMHREDQEWFREIAKATNKEDLLPALDDE